MGSSWRQNVFDFGWSNSDVRFIARLQAVFGPPQYVLIARGEYPGVYQIWFAPEQSLQLLILENPEPSHFPYGFPVFPD